MSDMRGNRMAMIFQEPMTSLNPAYTIGNQLEEALLRHKRVSRRQARERAVYLLDRVGITAAASRLKQYPHQLSGGLRQRVMIAMALMCSPALILADEPTTALDVTIQAQILHLLAELQREFAMGLVLITHDLGVVARIATRVVVMYAGQVVETGTGRSDLRAPRRIPTRAGCSPASPCRAGRGAASRSGTIPGMVPSLIGETRRLQLRRPLPAMSSMPAARRTFRWMPAAAAAHLRALHPPCRDRREPLPQRQRRGGAVSSAATCRHRALAPHAGSARRVAHVPCIGRACCRPKRHAAGGGRRQPRGACRARWWRWSASPAAARPRWRACCSACCRRQPARSASPASRRGAVAPREIATLVQPVFQDPYSSLNPRKPIGSIIALPLARAGASPKPERGARASRT